MPGWAESHRTGLQRSSDPGVASQGSRWRPAGFSESPVEFRTRPVEFRDRFGGSLNQTHRRSSWERLAGSGVRCGPDGG